MHFFNIELLNRFVIGPKRLYNFLSVFVMIKRLLTVSCCVFRLRELIGLKNKRIRVGGRLSGFLLCNEFPLPLSHKDTKMHKVKKINKISLVNLFFFFP